MTAPSRIVEINRLILTDLDIPPVRARRLHGLIEGELTRLLDADDILNDLSPGEVDHLPLPPPPVDGGWSDERLARSIAARVVEGVRHAARGKEESHGQE